MKPLKNSVRLSAVPSSPARQTGHASESEHPTKGIKMSRSHWGVEIVTHSNQACYRFLCLRDNKTWIAHNRSRLLDHGCESPESPRT